MSWNSKITFVFTHVILNNKFGVLRNRDIREHISRYMDLWEISVHVILVGNADAEGAYREYRAVRE